MRIEGYIVLFRCECMVDEFLESPNIGKGTLIWFFGTSLCRLGVEYELFLVIMLESPSCDIKADGNLKVTNILGDGELP